MIYYNFDNNAENYWKINLITLGQNTELLESKRKKHTRKKLYDTNWAEIKH